MPIRTLVVQTFKRYDEATQTIHFIPNRSIKNIIGRVGRAGKETRGRIVFANDTERAAVILVLRDIGLEPARGRLFRLIERIEEHFRQHNMALTNEVLEQQQPWFLALIDSIDHAIIDLVPEDISSDQITQCIDELLDRTLARHQGQSDAFKKTLYAVFRLRGISLQNTIPRDAWPVLKKSGATPRLWKAVNNAALLDAPSWQSLDDATDPKWRDSIILPLLAFTDGASETPAAFLAQVIEGWLAGLTYAEIANACESDLETILSVLCEEVGFRLQDSVSKLSQLAIAKHGEDSLSETAQAWPSLLQYGLGTLQQLDLFERGASDRLGVWGIQRHLGEQGVDLRGRDLVNYLRKNGDPVKSALAQDKRVPRMCAGRICAELKIR